MGVVVGRRELEHGAELRLGLPVALQAEVRDPQLLADRGLVGLEALGLLQRHRRLSSHALLQLLAAFLEQVVGLSHHVQDRESCAARDRRLGQVPRRPDLHSQHGRARIDRPLKRAGELERRAGQAMEMLRDFGRQHPQGRGEMLARARHSPAPVRPRAPGRLPEGLLRQAIAAWALAASLATSPGE